MDSFPRPVFPGVIAPDLAAALAQQPEVGGDAWDVTRLSAAELRQLYADGRRFWNHPLPEMARVVEVLLPRAERTLPLRFFDPGGAGPKLALLYVHGGGFVLGSNDTHQRIMRLLAERSGAIVVGVDYGLSPEHKFPFALEETLAAWRFLRAGGADFGIDPGRIAAGGDSAGAAIVLAACLDRRLAGEAAPFAALLLVYGAFGAGEETESMRLYSAPDYGLPKEDRTFYRQAFLRSPADGKDPRLRPLVEGALAGLPPIFLQAAELDPLRDDSYVLAEHLAAAGVATKVECYLGMLHGFFHMSRLVKTADRAVAEAAAWLRESLA